MKSKFITLILACIMCLSVMTSCDKSSDTDTNTADNNISQITTSDTGDETIDTDTSEVAPHEQVSYLLPITYFSAEDEDSTQEQLDEHSKDGLKYEFTNDGFILCTVVDMDAALKAAENALLGDFEDLTNPDSSLYTPSFKSITYNEDMSQITITVDSAQWAEYDSWWATLFLNRAFYYQQIMGRMEPNEGPKSLVTFVDENGSVIYAEDLSSFQ